MLPLHFENRSRRGVAQPGLEYSSGGRVVASSNLVTPTLIIKDLHGSVSPFVLKNETIMKQMGKDNLNIFLC